jgi:folate-binding protein YgfZ
MTPNPEAYRWIADRGVWSDRSGRSRLAITGPDRAKFLHNLVTSDVKRLAEGSGREAFVTSPQGKVLAYVTILATGDALLLRTEPESIEGLLPHLRKYGVFDDVAIEDVSSSTFEYHLAGPKVARALAGEGRASIPDEPLGHVSVAMEGVEVRFVRESPTGRPGLTLIGPAEVAGRVRALLATEGLAEVDAATFEAFRIEAGTPASGRDVTPGNLPQEVGRDALAINFVKGCYLGQETVARLDALGHVNRILKGLKVEGSAVPPAGATVSAGGKAVGSVTSSAWSPGWNAPVALAYVRVAQAGAGTRLDLGFEGDEASAVVADLPMLPPTGS